MSVRPKFLSLNSFDRPRSGSQRLATTYLFARRYPIFRERFGAKEFVRHSSSHRVMPCPERATARLERDQMNTSEKQRPVSDLDFCSWMLTAPPGSMMEYHRGSLAVDADLGLSKLADAQRQDLCEVRRRAFAAAAEGLVQLVQRRIGPNCFSYIAIIRSRQRHQAERTDDVVRNECRHRAETHPPILGSWE